MNKYRVRVSFPRGGSTYTIEASSLQDAAERCVYWRAVRIERIIPPFPKGAIPCP